jgi:hypothetical protein
MFWTVVAVRIALAAPQPVGILFGLFLISFWWFGVLQFLGGSLIKNEVLTSLRRYTPALAN